MFERGGEPHFLLTRRTEEVQAHKGQISFPGGMREGTETLQETALRETFEEVGIMPETVDLLGRFHDYESSTGFLVTPFAGYLTDPFEISPHAGEVAEVLLVPFGIFTNPANLRIEPMFRLGRVMDVYFYSYGRHQIWGLTARIIHDFLVELGMAPAR
jgi:8-oxo-dGTP pyrophosphatase MutT (NUDIX family)